MHAFHETCAVFACELMKGLYNNAYSFLRVSHTTHLAFPSVILYIYFNFFQSLNMALNWVPPPNGTLKVNVHIVSFDVPVPNGNTSGLGVVLRTSDGNLVNCITSTIMGLDSL